MKIRNGFISNSSSSSFICDFRKKEISIKEVKKDLQIILDFYNTLFKKDLKFNDVFNEPFFVTKKDFNELFKLQTYGMKKEEMIGHLLIESKGTNTVPYILLDIIENKFKGTRSNFG